MPDVLRVDVQPDKVQVTPGGQPVVVQARIFNGSQIIDEFNVTAMGTGQWLEVEAATVRLFPDKEDLAELRFAIPLGQFVPAGPRTVGIQVASASNPELSTIQQITVHVAEVVSGEVMTLEPQICRGDGSAQLTATVSNGGNTPMRLTMSGHDAESVAKFAFSPQVVDVPPGGQATVGVKVSAPRAFFGQERQRQLTINADGGHSPMSASANFIQAPRFTTGSVRWLRVLLTLIAAGLMIFGAFQSWTTGVRGVELDYQKYGEMAFDATLSGVETNLSSELVSFFTSAGFVTIFFAVLVALGSLTRSGKTTRVAGALALILILALFAVLFVSPKAIDNPTIDSGGAIAAAGALLAIIAGSVGT